MLDHIFNYNVLKRTTQIIKIKSRKGACSSLGRKSSQTRLSLDKFISINIHYVVMPDKPYKTLHVPVSEDLYYELIQLKGKWKAQDWPDFLQKVVEHARD